MNHPRISIFGVERQNIPGDPSSKVLHVDTVLIDRSTKEVPAVVYQFNDSIQDVDPHQALSQILAPSSQRLFTIMGQVVRVCTKSKRIHLMDETIILYKRLVTFAGPQHSPLYDHPEEHFCEGVFRTIVESMRCTEIRNTISTLPQSSSLSEGSSEIHNKRWASTTEVLTPSILDLGDLLKQLPIHLQEGSDRAVGLDTGHCNLYQVQT